MTLMGGGGGGHKYKTFAFYVIHYISTIIYMYVHFWTLQTFNCLGCYPVPYSFYLYNLYILYIKNKLKRPLNVMDYKYRYIQILGNSTLNKVSMTPGISLYRSKLNCIQQLGTCNYFLFH